MLVTLSRLWQFYNVDDAIILDDVLNLKGDSDVGDIAMLMTLWWWLTWNVGDRIIMLATFLSCSCFFQCIKSVINVSNLSTHLVPNIRHQHKWTYTVNSTVYSILNSTFHTVMSIDYSFNSRWYKLYYIIYIIDKGRSWQISLPACYGIFNQQLSEPIK